MPRDLVQGLSCLCGPSSRAHVWKSLRSILVPTLLWTRQPKIRTVSPRCALRPLFRRFCWRKFLLNMIVRIASMSVQADMRIRVPPYILCVIFATVPAPFSTHQMKLNSSNTVVWEFPYTGNRSIHPTKITCSWHHPPKNGPPESFRAYMRDPLLMWSRGIFRNLLEKTAGAKIKKLATWLMGRFETIGGGGGGRRTCGVTRNKRPLLSSV